MIKIKLFFMFIFTVFVTVGLSAQSPQQATSPLPVHELPDYQLQAKKLYEAHFKVTLNQEQFGVTIKRNQENLDAWKAVYEHYKNTDEDLYYVEALVQGVQAKLKNPE